MIIQKEKEQYFQLDTASCSYCFRVMETGQLQHLYYGRKIRVEDPSVITEKHAFAPGGSVLYDQEHPQFTLEDICLETSGLGKGDIREPMIEIVAADGSNTTDFIFQEAVIGKGKESSGMLPGSYSDQDDMDHLKIVMQDRNHGYTLELHYYVYEKEDVITRNCRFINTSQDPVDLKRLLSLQLDFPKSGYDVTSFHGIWGREMQRSRMQLTAGKLVGESYTGTSSSRTNPFFVLSDHEADEEKGDCFGFHLIYSGNHYEAVEVSGFGKTRVVSGIQPRNFSFSIAPGEMFEAPEAVMTYSYEGFGGMSRHLHDFVHNHIVRGYWRDRERPVLLNSWEASYFHINEASLLKLAKAGKEAGVELFVMDDGWFGTRDDDHQSLGDWTPNPKKLPHGLDGLADKIRALGLEFGLWIEPEMVNVNSNLYRAHPDWVMAIPGMNHSEGRNQRVLDFCNPQVVSYITESMTELLSSAKISYVKWDMNRNVSDYYSPYLPPERQQEVAHRYVLGVYQLMDALTKRFPEILFEGCASGGNRFDLGMLCYFPQIWGSDNTDAISRLSIQEGYSYGYPLSTVGAHVSACPNHQTLRTTPLETRFAVAAFGVLGYECNLCDMKKEDLDAIKLQITLYKKYRKVLQQGDFYRQNSGNITQWTVVSKDQSQAVTMLVQKETKAGEAYIPFAVKGLKPDATYHFFGLKGKYSIKNFGDLVNMVSPVHIRQDSLVHNALARLVKMDGETEDAVCSGAVLMEGGLQLCQSFVGSGYNDQVRFFPDFGSRLYFIEEIEETEEVGEVGETEVKEQPPEL